MNYQIKEVNDPDEFLSYESEWNTLLANSDCDIPFLRHEWLAIWWKHFGQSNRLAVVLGLKNNTWAFAIPLMEVKTSFAGVSFDVLQSMTNHHSFRCNFIVRKGEEAVLPEFWRYLRARSRRWDLMLVQDVPIGTPLWTKAIDTARSHDFPVGLWNSFESPYVVVNGQWDTYLKSRSNHFLKALNRRIRKIGADHGEPRLEILSKTELDVEAFSDALAIEGSGWKRESGTAIAMHPALRAFYAEWAEKSAENTWFRMSFLRVGKTRIAFEFGVAYAGTWYAIKSGYDPVFRYFSPGQLLCRDILRYCFDNRIAEYDFLGAAAEDKLRWTQETRKHAWLYVYNDTFLATLHRNLRFRIAPQILRWLRRPTNHELA